jgi:hypothetical protein
VRRNIYQTIGTGQAGHSMAGLDSSRPDIAFRIDGDAEKVATVAGV